MRIFKEVIFTFILKKKKDIMFFLMLSILTVKLNICSCYKMADTGGTEHSQDPDEVPEEDLDDELQTLLHFSKHGDGRRAQPWEQWTFREKANYLMDRIFLGFLILFLIVLLFECTYKMWYVSNVKKMAQFVSDSVIFLFDWLFTQERQEEIAEL